MNGGLLGLVAIQNMRARALRARANQVAGTLTSEQILRLIDDQEKLLDHYTLARGQILGLHPFQPPPP